MIRLLGLYLIIFGFLLVIASFILGEVGKQSNFGGVILIGPIPIVFGSSPEAAFYSIILSTILMLVMILFYRRLG